MLKWIRQGGKHALTKAAKLSDGEINLMLLGSEGGNIRDTLEARYDSFTQVYEKRSKAMTVLALALALQLLSYLGVVKEFGTAGLKVEARYLDHFALMFGAVAGLNFTIHDARFAAFAATYRSFYQRCDAAGRAYCLLAFPLAFDVGDFAPSTRGYPKFMWPDRSHLAGLPWAGLLVLGLAAFTVGSLILSGSIAYKIWFSSVGAPWFSRGIVLLSLYVTLLALFTPRQGVFRRMYRHYGLVDVLTSLGSRDSGKLQKRQMQIAAIQARTDPAEDGPTGQG